MWKGEEDAKIILARVGSFIQFARFFSAKIFWNSIKFLVCFGCHDIINLCIPKCPDFVNSLLTSSILPSCFSYPIDWFTLVFTFYLTRPQMKLSKTICNSESFFFTLIFKSYMYVYMTDSDSKLFKLYFMWMWNNIKENCSTKTQPH
jgi:hypothetical protein